MAKVLIGCETSGIDREAFIAAGHDAWSCDLLPSDTPTNRHIIGDVRDVMQGDWDMLAVMHPPCTRRGLETDRDARGRGMVITITPPPINEVTHI